MLGFICGTEPSSENLNFQRLGICSFPLKRLSLN
ncbi:rCG63728, partial [Rattus norvegicus]